MTTLALFIQLWFLFCFLTEVVTTPSTNFKSDPYKHAYSIRHHDIGRLGWFSGWYIHHWILGFITTHSAVHEFGYWAISDHTGFLWVLFGFFLYLTKSDSFTELLTRHLWRWTSKIRFLGISVAMRFNNKLFLPVYFFPHKKFDWLILTPMSNIKQ